MNRESQWQMARVALAQFVIIVTGVLVALAVDQWRNKRSDLALETQYVERLINDLAADTANYAGYGRRLERKASLLKTLITNEAADLKVLNPDTQLALLTNSGVIALPAIRSSTFEELQSTGRLGLIRSVKVRDGLARYYSGYEHISRILAQPAGSYRELLWSSLPGDLVYESNLRSGSLPPIKLQRGVNRLISSPDLESAVNSELHYTTRMLFYMGEYRRVARELLTTLNARR